MPRDPAPPPVLPDLDAIDWSTTWHAYGPATNVPKLLRDLASPDPAVQAAALDDLSFTIYHQGSVYPASAQAVPFLAELLRSPHPHDKQPVLEILQLLAQGQSYAENHAGFPLFESAVARDPQLAARTEAERAHVPLLRARLREHRPTYLALLHAPQPNVRLHATALLALLGHDLAPEISPALDTAARADPNPDVRANALLALARTAPERAAPTLQHAATADPDDLPRVTGLAWFVTVAPRLATPADLDALHRHLRDAPDALRDRYAALPSAGPFDEHLALPLAAAGPDHARRALEHLTTRFQRARYLPDSTMLALLHTAERADGPFDPARGLTPAQAHAVRIVAGVAWPKPQQTFANALDALRAFNLPTNQKAINQLLRSTGGPPPTPPSANPTAPPRWYQFWRR